MLITIFRLVSEARTRELKDAISADISARYGICEGAVGINFSPTYRENGRLVILATGEDARGKEQAITGIVGTVCEAFCKANGLACFGFENPNLAGQESDE